MSEASRTRILFVHHRSELGGAPTSLSYLIRELDRTRFDPYVFCPGGRAADLFRRSGATVFEGPVAAFTHIWASTYRGRRWLLLGRELLRLPGHAIAFRRVLRDGRFGVVHLNDSPLVPAAWLAHRARIPVAWHLRSALPEREGPRRSAFLRTTIRRLGSAAIAINADVADSFAVGAEVVPNSVDLERFRPGPRDDARRRLGLAAERDVVAYVGFIYPSKGIREYLLAAAAAREAGHDATFLIVGGAVRSRPFFASSRGRILRRLGLANDHEQEAHDLVRALALEGDVRFIAFTDAIEEAYRAADILVAPSLGPELPRPIAEAAATALPVVALGTQTGGGIILDGVTGVIVREQTGAALAEAIGGLLADPARRAELGRAARRHAEAAFDPKANTQLVEAVYARILGTGPRAAPVLADRAG